ncbi:hypothetical protein AAAC51_07060 [Priestia megaterium]
MGGLKNMHQVYGATPFETVRGATIQDRQMNRYLREYTPYCQFCGGEIIDATQNEIGQSVDPEWERLYKAHSKCYRERMNSVR